MKGTRLPRYDLEREFVPVPLSPANREVHEAARLWSPIAKAIGNPPGATDLVLEAQHPFDEMTEAAGTADIALTNVRSIPEELHGRPLPHIGEGLRQSLDDVGLDHRQ